jgi:limonene-1,2-epoxide hydrolase
MTVNSNEEVIRAVIDAWTDSIPAVQEAIRKHFTDDCRWEQVGVPTTIGPEEAARFMATVAEMGYSGATVEYRNVAAVGDVVFTERVDWMVRTDGSRVGPMPVVGVTEFRDGKISAWREYFDSRSVRPPPTD